MPTSRRRKKDRKPHDKTRLRLRERAAQRPTYDMARHHLTDAEAGTVTMIAEASGRLPRTPECDGPLLIHLDGAFECHGEGCPGGLAVYHSDDTVTTCHSRRDVDRHHDCSRCAASDPSHAASTCTGVQIEHDDGVDECSLADQCAGLDTIHLTSKSCRWDGPCARNCQDHTMEPHSRGREAR